MFKCLIIFIYLTLTTIVNCAPGYVYREKQTWHDDPWSHSKTAVRKKRDTKNIEIEVDFVKGYEITDLKDKEIYAISPLNDRSTQKQDLNVDINTLISFLNSSNFKEKCNQYNCVVDAISDSNSNSDERAIENYNNDDYYNSNQYYEDKSQSSSRDRRLPSQSYNDNWKPPPPHNRGPPPPPPHQRGPPPPPPHHGGPPPPPPHHGGPPPPPPHRGGPPPPPHHGGPPPHHHGGPPPPPPPPHYDYYSYEQSSEDFGQPPGPPHYDVRSRRRDPPPPPEYRDPPRPPPYDYRYPPPPPPHGYREPPPPPPPDYGHRPSPYDYRDRPPPSSHGHPPPYGRPPHHSPYESPPPPPPRPNHHRPHPPNNYYDQQEDIGYRSSLQESFDETKRMSDEERQTRQSSTNDNFGDNNRGLPQPAEYNNNFNGDTSQREMVEPQKMAKMVSQNEPQINDSGYMLDAIFGENTSNQYNARDKEYLDEETTSLSPFFFQVAAVTPEDGN